MPSNPNSYKLRPIDKEYLMKLDFHSFIENGKEYLKKNYLAVYKFNSNFKIIDLVDVTVFLEKTSNNWVISKCLSYDSKAKNVFRFHFKTNNIRELINFNNMFHKDRFN